MTKQPRSPKQADRSTFDEPLVDFQRDSLGYAIKRAQVRAYEVFFRILGEDTLSPARMTALSMIGSEEGISQSALAERLGVKRASMVKVIDTLESLGLVTRQPVPEDRRSYALTLTKTGRGQLQRYGSQVAEMEKVLAKRLSDNERRQLISLLDKIGRD